MRRKPIDPPSETEVWCSATGENPCENCGGLFDEHREELTGISGLRYYLCPRREEGDG
jgi:hypothetical protein